MKYSPIVLGLCAICLLSQTSSKANDVSDKPNVCGFKNEVFGIRDFQKNDKLASGALPRNLIPHSSSPETMLDTTTGKFVGDVTTYSLHKLDSGDVRKYEDTDKLANLQISGSVTPVVLLYSDHGKFQELTIDATKKLFGEPSFQGKSERDPQDGLYTFNLKGFGPFREPDIFHLDIETGASGKCKSYRVRGIGIVKPGWQELKTE